MNINTLLLGMSLQALITSVLVFLKVELSFWVWIVIAWVLMIASQIVFLIKTRRLPYDD